MRYIILLYEYKGQHFSYLAIPKIIIKKLTNTKLCYLMLSMKLSSSWTLGPSDFLNCRKTNSEQILLLSISDAAVMISRHFDALQWIYYWSILMDIFPKMFSQVSLLSWLQSEKNVGNGQRICNFLFFFFSEEHYTWQRDSGCHKPSGSLKA